ncbi:MAG: substrate-binding domain-containing protein [Campylobacterales bacterium]|nr:substrate-binding domain-containing protein [Campylobacterales bacterium]
MRYFLLFITFINIVFAKEYVIGFAQDTLANDWRAAQVQEVRDEVAKHPHLKLIVKDAKGKVSNQIRDIQRFINDEVDFIITSPIDAKVTSLVLKKAIDKGIKVILISRGVQTQDYDVFISPNNYQIAKDSAKYLLKQMNYKGVVLMLEGVKGATSTLERTKGFEEVASNYKDIKVVKRRANYLRSDAIKVMEQLYKDGIKFDAIFSQSDSMLIGAREVMKRLKKPLVDSVGIDYIGEAKEAILNGEQLASFTYPTSGCEGVMAIVDLIDKKEIPKNIILDTVMVTKDNANLIKPLF